MGIETLVTESNEKDFPMLGKLCDEFKINIALHNHPKDSHYWNPDMVLKGIEGQSKRIGSCSDTGHWVRSGLNPVECLKKLDGHVISLHFKDLVDGHDAPWGTGKSDVKGQMAELKRQGFRASSRWSTSTTGARTTPTWPSAPNTSSRPPTNWRPRNERLAVAGTATIREVVVGATCGRPMLTCRGA